MNTLKDYLPRKASVPVGEVSLVLQELSIAKRDALISIIMEDVGLMSSDSPLMTALREAGKAALDEIKEGEVNSVESAPSTFAAQIARIITKVIGSTLSAVSCMSLDNAANRKFLGIKDEVKPHEKYGFEYSPAMWATVKDSLTPRQEITLLETLIEVNDFVGLVKNYFTLVTKTMSQVREKAGVTGEKIKEAVEAVAAKKAQEGSGA